MNPFLEAERARKRESLLAATEADLAKIAAACARARRPLRGQDKIAVRADRVLRRRKVAKHFTIQITDDEHFSYARNQDSITAEASPGRHLRAAHQRRPPATWTAARWSPPTRPWPRSSGPSAPSIPTWTSGPSGTAPRTGSARTCSCGCCRTTSPGTCRPGSRPLLFTDDDKPAAQAARPSPVAPAARSPRALAKAATKHTPGDLPVHSFATLLADLGTICLNTIAPADPALPGFRLVTTPTARPAAGLRPARRQPPPRGRVVSSPAPHTTKAQVNGPTRGSLGGTTG